MAYMNQEKKKEINTLLKSIVPNSWKYSLKVENLSTIVMTIRSAPHDLLKGFDSYFECQNSDIPKGNLVDRGYAEFPLWISAYKSYLGGAGETLEKIFEALNLNNHDRSDVMTDYFDVGHYVRVNLGTYEKKFENTEK